MFNTNLNPLQGAYYAKTAYTSSTIPDQLPEPKKTWLLNFGKIRLPWGNTSQAAPIDMLAKFKVKNLRYIKKNYSKEKQQKMTQETDHLGACFNQECYRMPHVTKRLTVIGLLMSGGKILFMISSIIFTIIYFFELLGSNDYVKFTVSYFLDMYLFYLIPFIIWKGSYFAFKHFRGFFLAKSLGPQYEFNRRTGMFTLYDKKNKQASVHPFYEFDAYLNSFISKQGIMQYQLYIIHRYSHKKMMSMYPLQGPTYNIEPQAAVWDFLKTTWTSTNLCPIFPNWKNTAT